MASHKENTNKQKKTYTLVAVGILTSLMVLALVLTYQYFNTASQYAPAKAVTVEQTLKNTPADLKIGIVVSYTENTTEGRGWDLNGEGANVAKWRLQQGGTTIETIVVSDQGSENGAKKAIAELKTKQVTAVLAFTSGPHTQTLIEAATAANLPLILPYAPAPANPAANTWYGQINTAEKTAATKELLAQLSCQHTLTDTELKPLIEAPIAAPAEHAETTNEAQQAPSENKTNPELTKLINKLSEGNQTCVLVETPETNSQTLLEQLSLRNLTPTIILNQPVTNADWLQKLKDSNAYHTNLYTIGVPTSQLGQSQTPAAKLNYAGFVEATQQMAADPNTPSFRNDANFAQTGAYADTLSYDSFIAIVRAAINAKTNDSAEVAKTLQNLQLTDNETTLGKQLDFAKSTYAPAVTLTLVELDGKLVWVEHSNTNK